MIEAACIWLPIHAHLSLILPCSIIIHEPAHNIIVMHITINYSFTAIAVTVAQDQHLALLPDPGAQGKFYCYTLTSVIQTF